MTTTVRTTGIPTQARPAEPATSTVYTIVHAGRAVYAGFDPDAAIWALEPLLEAEEDDVVVYATTGGVSDRYAAQAILAEATIEVSAWPTCGYPHLLDPTEYREHVETCRTCGRED